MAPTTTVTAVALASVIYGDNRESYDAWYDRYGERMDGFPGIWAYFANAASILEQVIGDDDDYFIEILDLFGVALVSASPMMNSEIKKTAELIKERFYVH